MSSRKDFLTTLAAAAATPAVAPARAVKHRAHSMKLPFDRAAFERVLQKGALHKQCFAARDISGGDVLFAMNNTTRAYSEYMGDQPGAVHTVAVLYHGASILMAMNDAFWNDILVHFVRKGGARDQDAYADVRAGKGNPYLHWASKNPDDVSVESLVAGGSSFLVCHNAILGFGGGFAQTLDVSAVAMHERMLSSLVPGALAVPAGVMAINAAQEAKFTYVQY